MLSILIPTHNHYVKNLVYSLHHQCIKANLTFEILIYDDASTVKEIVKKNLQVRKLSNVSFSICRKNIGRSAIRNRLWKLAKYNWLLFLDADVSLKSNDFIKNYIQAIDTNSEVIYGGLQYNKKIPEHNRILRWKYGQKREVKSKKKREVNSYLNLLSCNFLILKNIIKYVPFNEMIPKEANEDTLFSYQLKLKKINVVHIDNPVKHTDLEPSNKFIEKSLLYSKYSLFFVEKKLMDKEYIKIIKIYHVLKKMKLKFIFSALYRLFKTFLKNHLQSKNPSMFIFDLYRLSYLCYISKD
ncbi:MAG: glycosyl transferase [Flavobacteriaceae bacterium]|nr:glycosyl transferase [Flavobacteriaceae bacterium]|tara:strand:+ start:10170 stop:11063 length:894 start_codon:yes stop_codon:yes gene_type:complete